MSFLKIDINDSIRNYFKQLKTSEQNLSNLQLLEPFSIILKLAIISFKEEHTKIAISDNNMFIQTPSFYQGIIRYMYGNNREDICFLLKPIMRALELYDPAKDEKIKYIFERAAKGLSKLKKSYNSTSSTVCHSLDLYISIINSHLNGETIMVESYLESRTAPELNLSVNTRVNLEKIFTHIWTDSDITLLYSMFKTADENPKIEKTYIKSIHNLIKSKIPEINKRIEKTKNFI